MPQLNFQNITDYYTYHHTFGNGAVMIAKDSMQAQYTIVLQ